MMGSGDFVIDTSSQVYAAALHPQSTLIVDSELVNLSPDRA